MEQRYTHLLLALLFAQGTLCAQLTVTSSFDPVNTGAPCGISYNSTAGELWIYACGSSTIERYAVDGTFVGSIPMVGETADDADLDMAPTALVMGGTNVPEGQLLVTNGETAGAEIYAIDTATGAVIDTLDCGFGESHTVGGAYHPTRGTFFLVEDQNAITQANQVAEIDALTGDTLHTWPTLPAFSVNYGDIDVSPVSGNLFIVSSNEGSIAEFTPDGVWLQSYVLPGGVSGLSGIALDNDLLGAWVSSTGGTVYELGNFPMAVPFHAAGVLARLHPNPADDHVELELPDGVTVWELTLRDAAGRELRRSSLDPHDRTFAFDVSDLDAGSYSITFTGPLAPLPCKLVVAH